MIVLGLGSNVGDRLHHLRTALTLLKNIPALTIQQVSPVYISDAWLPDNAPHDWNMPYLNVGIRCDTTLSPQELLEKTKQIEKIVGRTEKNNKGPRIIDIDILAWDDLVLYDKKLHIPHESLHERPFAFWPLADVAPRWIYPLPGVLQGKTAAEITAQWGSHFSGEAPLHTKQIPQRIDTPILVGIVNLTPDSFSDDGKFLNSTFAMQHIRSQLENGAEIIDIGAEATGPHATPITPEIEWQRLLPILEIVQTEKNKMYIQPKISIDTRYAETAKKAFAFEIDWINDVSGGEDPAMYDVIKNHSCDYVIMHHLGIPVSKQTSTLSLHEDPVLKVMQWAEKKLSELENKGIARSRIIIDIGIGYGKTAEQSLELIKKINLFKKLNVRLLIGHSRKSFLGQFTDKLSSERDIETLAISSYLAEQSVDYLRVHHIETHARFLKVMQAIHATQII